MQPEAEQKGQWKFHNEDGQADTADGPAAGPPGPEQAPEESVTWTASEFIAHQRPPGWYVLLALSLISLCGLIYLLTHDIISIITIVIVAILYLVISKAKPRSRTYIIDHQGISIDDKFYPFSGFKSFAVTQEGAIGCIILLPLKRLLPEIDIYFAPDDATKILEVLVKNLPNDQRQERKTDRLMKKLHF